MTVATPPIPSHSPSLLGKGLIADLAERAARAEAAARAAQEVVRREKIAELGAPTLTDPTGLIGQELTPLVTTLGSLEAKRLSTSPAWARALTERLAAHGVGPGTVVAASLSGSLNGSACSATVWSFVCNEECQQQFASPHRAQLAAPLGRCSHDALFAGLRELCRSPDLWRGAQQRQLLRL